MKNIYFSIAFLLILFCATRSVAQTITPIIYPQYSTDSSTGGRLPYVFRAKISGLTANTLYQFYARAASTTIDGTNGGGGAAIFIKQNGNFTYSLNPGFGGPGGGNDTIRTNALGEATTWFAFEPVRGNSARFNEGNYIHARVFIRQSAGGGFPIVLTVTDSILNKKIDVKPTNATGVYSTSLAPSKDIVFLYDNETGNGRPLTGTWIETDGLNFKSGTGAGGTPNATAYPNYYRNYVDTVTAAWGSFIPNDLTKGLQRIERRKLSDATIAWANTDADGIWDVGTVNTVNATGGQSALNIATDDAPLLNVPPKIFFTNTTQQVSENNGTATISVGLKFPSANSTSADIVVASGSASGTTDYTYTTKTVTFPANSTTPQTVTVNISNDGIGESLENIVFGLTNLTNSATIGSPANDTLTIIDDDLPFVGFASTSVSNLESTTSVTIPVNIQFPNANATSVNIAVTGGSAVLGSDFTFSNQTLTFPASSSSAINVPLTIINDAVTEADETIIFTLSAATNGAILGNTTFTYTIKNDDITPFVTFLTPTAQTIKENGGSVNVRVQLTNPTITATNITVSAFGGNATSGLDYVLASNTLTFPANTSGIQTLNIPISDDNLVEGVETVVLRLANPSNPVNYINEYDTITINDNDLPYYTIGQINKNDGLGVADSMNVRCELHGVVYGPNIRPLGYQFFMNDRTGGIQVYRLNGLYGGYIPQDKDSVVVKGEIQQLNGQLQITNLDTVYKVGTGSYINPTVITSYSEANEGNYVTLKYVHLLNTASWPTGAANATVTVVDQNNKNYLTQIYRQTDIDSTQPSPYWFHISGILAQSDASIPWDSLYYLVPLSLQNYETVYPQLSFVTGADTVAENIGLDSVQVNLQWVPRTATSTSVAFTGGTATFGQDFNFTSATLNFPAGFAVSSKQKVGIIIIDDASPELDETLILSILGPTNNAVAVSPAVHNVVIRFNDGANGISSKSNDAKVSVYPNPANSKLFIKADGKMLSASLSDMNGRAIMSFNENAIDVSGLAKGLYLLQITTTDGVFNTKVVVE